MNEDHMNEMIVFYLLTWALLKVGLSVNASSQKKDVHLHKPFI